MWLENLRSCNRQKYKRAMNKLIRIVNRNIKNDWLWNGRFVVSQDEAYFYPYEDHSGAEYICRLTLTDTKTGKKEYTAVNNYGTEFRIWNWVNDCITKQFKVWEENPNPNEQARLEGRTPEWVPHYS